jgi:hypothetical protein
MGQDLLKSRFYNIMWISTDHESYDGEELDEPFFNHLFLHL